MFEFRLVRYTVLGALLVAALQARATADTSTEHLAQAWDHVQFELTDRKERLEGFTNVADEAEKVLQVDPANTEAMVWEAISLSSQAGEIRGPSALGRVRKARDLLLAAEDIDPDTLGDGSIYSSLGSLYYQVPGFPIGFGNKKTARRYLEMALDQDSDGLDPNYFMADFLERSGDYKSALKYVRAAEEAPSRSGREIADAGRKKELKALKTKIEMKLEK